VAVVQYTVTQKYTEQHNETEYPERNIQGYRKRWTGFENAIT